jgi:hypothetical protein
MHAQHHSKTKGCLHAERPSKNTGISLGIPDKPEKKAGRGNYGNHSRTSRRGRARSSRGFGHVRSGTRTKVGAILKRGTAEKIQENESVLGQLAKEEQAVVSSQ